MFVRTLDELEKLGRIKFLADDSFHRRVFSTNVTIQNIRSMNRMSL